MDSIAFKTRPRPSQQENLLAKSGYSQAGFEPFPRPEHAASAKSACRKVSAFPGVRLLGSKDSLSHYLSPNKSC